MQNCMICNSENLISNQVLENFQNCYYCSFAKNKHENKVLQNIDIDLYLINKIINSSKYKNAVCISNNQKLIQLYENQNIKFFSENEDSNFFNKKNASKLLKNGKIDLLIVPDLSFINVNKIFECKSLFSENMEIFFGIFTPDFIISNSNQFSVTNYIYSLLSVSKICELNNFDIYDYLDANNYFILKIKKYTNSDKNFMDKLQAIWDNHYACKFFHDV